MILVDIIKGAVGALLVLWVLWSVIRTVVLPRPERVLIARATLAIVRRTGDLVIRLVRSERTRAQISGTYGPVALVSLPLAWSLVIVGSFALVFSSMGVTPWTEALTLSASSLTTLGFVAAETTATRLVAALEAFLGLGIVALLISFLPTIYTAFSRREAAINHLTVRAGDPPHPTQFMRRARLMGDLDTDDGGARLAKRWADWEEWFVDVGETHTTFPALAFFGSVRPERSWLTAAETALDSAALLLAFGFRSSGAAQETMIRSGYLALREIADFFGIEYDAHPSPGDPVSVTRADFDRLAASLDSQTVHASMDLDAAWRAYAGWRVNYDAVVVGLAELIDAPRSHWHRDIPVDKLR